MADEQAAYLDSSRRSEQLSCRKYFHPRYGLIYMIFQRFINILEIIINSKTNRKLLGVPSLVYTEVYQRVTSGSRGVPVDQSTFDWSTGVGPSCH